MFSKDLVKYTWPRTVHCDTQDFKIQFHNLGNMNKNLWIMVSFQCCLWIRNQNPKMRLWIKAKPKSCNSAGQWESKRLFLFWDSSKYQRGSSPCFYLDKLNLLSFSLLFWICFQTWVLHFKEASLLTSYFKMILEVHKNIRIVHRIVIYHHIVPRSLTF